MSRRRRDGRSGKRWSYTAGSYGKSVRVFQSSSGIIYYAYGNGNGGEKRGSLGHRDRQQAIEFAEVLAAKFRLGESPPSTITLGWAWKDYLIKVTPQKTPASQQHDQRVAYLTISYYGAEYRPRDLTRRELDRFVQDRLSGAINSRGRFVADPTARQPVSGRTVERDVATMKAMWQYHEDCGHIESNPIRRISIPKDEPSRELASDDRADLIEEVASQIRMTVSWFGDRKEVMSPFRCIFRLARETGRRIYPILCLRFENLELERTASAPWGSITWPQDTDKQRRQWRCPLNARAREAIDWALEQRPIVGAGYIFPSPRSLEKPVRYELALNWLRRAEALAGLEPQKRAAYHAYRRAFATKRKHLPAKDVAAAGGWKNTFVVQEIYQQSDDETLLRVITQGAKLRAVG